MAKAVVAIVKTVGQAEQIVLELERAGFSKDDISALLPDKSGTRDFAHRQGTKAPEGAAACGATGGVLGGALGWLAGVGALAIPGVGPFVAAGPILAALGGAAVGAGLGGLTGFLVGLGFPEIEARRYEGKLREGNILISVHTEDRDDQSRAKEIFERAGAEDVSSQSESSVPHH